MKKLTLRKGAFLRGEVLTRAQLKKVMGGDGSSSGGSEDPCFATFFLVTAAGCGYKTCTGPAVTTNPDPTKVDCMCTTTITIPQPCGYA